MARKSKKIYQATKTKKPKRQQTLYERKALILLTASLYIILGVFDKIPFFVFQALFIIEGFAFFQDSMKSSVKKSSIVVGVLCVAWSVVVSLQTGLSTGYKFSISNQTIVCNFIYVAILGILIFQTNKRKNLYKSAVMKNISICICSIAIVGILSLLFLIYMLQMTEAQDLEITPFLKSILKLSEKAWSLAVEHPIAEWMLQCSVICSVLLQSNKRYIKSHNTEKEAKKIKRNGEEEK